MQNNNTGYLIKTNKFGMNFELFFAFSIVFGQVLAGRYNFIMHALSNDGFYSAKEDFLSVSDMPLEPRSTDIFEQLWNDICSFFVSERNKSRGIPPVLFSDSDAGLERGRKKFGKGREEFIPDSKMDILFLK